MSQTEGPVPPTVKSLLRRPFRLNLGSPPDVTPESPPETAPKAAPRPATKGSTTQPARRSLSDTGHQGSDPAEPAVGKSATHLDQGQILDATAACLDQAGYDRTTIRQIAKRLECAVGSIYRYFTDKRELLDAVVQRRFLPIAQAVEAGQHPDLTAQQYLRAARASTEQYRLMFWLAAVGRTPDQPAAIPDVIERILAGWTTQLGDANTARCRWALLHGQVMLGHDLDCTHLPDQANTPQPTQALR